MLVSCQPSGRGLHRVRTIEHQLYTPRRGGPESEGHACDPSSAPKRMLVWRIWRSDQNLLRALHSERPNRDTGGHAVPANARTEPGGACRVEPDANCLPRRGLPAVSSSTFQCPQPGTLGKVNSIASGAALSTT